ncbi:MAG: hypothetical protein MUO43_06875 [Desulfobacterales bacterium]|nr:hypothetical protein [Desulfobacterales bacterium]
MATYVNFSEVLKNTDGSIFLRIKSNEPAIHVRLLGNAVKTCRVYHDKTWVNMSLDDAKKLYQEHPYIFRFPPRQTYAVLVIDRADDKVKILEFPTTVFREFSKRFEVTGENPGGKSKGEEWKVKSTGKGKNTTYTAAYIDTVALTDAELNKIKEFKAEKDLPDYYPTSSYDEVVEEVGLSKSAVSSLEI